MDAIRKKMKSLKDETDQLYAIIQKFEDATKEANRVADQVKFDCSLFVKISCCMAGNLSALYLSVDHTNSH